MPGSTMRVAIAALLLAVAPELSPVIPEPPAYERSFEPDSPGPSPLVRHVARHYRIPESAAARAVDAAYLAAREVGVDPLLVLAVIGVESSFNPAAQSRAGAKGLMQIIPVYHGPRLDEYGGEEGVFDPLTNIAVGTRILNDYIARTGSLEAGLQSYNGAASDPTTRYARKVIAERERLRQTTAQGSAR
jgi:soluble lytic murein transglycosylase-like protein